MPLTHVQKQLWTLLASKLSMNGHSLLWGLLCKKMCRTPSMQRALQAGARVGSRASSARRLKCATEDFATELYPRDHPYPSSPSRTAANPSAALREGSISDAQQQLFLPASGGAGRQAFASAAQAASISQQQQQLFSFRQASHERPASHAKLLAPTADVRIAVVARLARR